MSEILEAEAFSRELRPSAVSAEGLTVAAFATAEFIYRPLQIAF